MNFAAAYMVNGHVGVWRLIGYARIRGEAYDWTGFEEEDREHVRAVLIDGDDRVHTFRLDELSAIKDSGQAVSRSVSSTAEADPAARDAV